MTRNDMERGSTDRAQRAEPETQPTGNRRASAETCIYLMLAAVIFWVMTGFTLADAALPTANSVEPKPAALLRVKHRALQDQLATNAFQRPLVIESTQSSKDVKGEVYAVVPYPFARASESLGGPQAWCEILILHLNTKACRVSPDKQRPALLMNVGKKFDQPLEDSFRLTFAWQVIEQNAEYLNVQLTADIGPLSTHDYRIVVEAIPLENGTTFLHLSYAYGFGVTGRLAMLAYLKTVGSSKVGFTMTGKDNDGKPAHVDGMRGLVERNTMRYYLAIDTYLGAPALAQFEKRINDWFNSVERYPQQLHEMDKAEYLNMKRKEYRRQQLGGIANDKAVAISAG